MLTDIITKTCQDMCGGLEADALTSEPPGKPLVVDKNLEMIKFSSIDDNLTDCRFHNSG